MASILRCSVVSCQKTKEEGVNLFTFPRNRHLCEVWADFTGNPYFKVLLRKGSKLPLHHFRICSDHFKDTDFQNELRKKLLRDRAPTVFRPPVQPPVDATSSENDLTVSIDSPRFPVQKYCGTGEIQLGSTSLRQLTLNMELITMAPLQSSLTCSVCDDEFSSVSTLHCHQMFLHTTEELSLAILSLRQLPVSPSTPAGDRGTIRSVFSPSNDCEDKPLRNGLAKYPRFLLASGGFKAKPVISESKKRSIYDEKNTSNKQVNDKENVLKDKCFDEKGLDRSDGNSSVQEGSISNEKQLTVKTTAESFRSRLWGPIKTLDGKPVDAPIVKLDSRRDKLSFKPSYMSEKKSLNISKSSDNVNSRTKSLGESSKASISYGKSGQFKNSSCYPHNVDNETSNENLSDDECSGENGSNDCQTLESNRGSNEHKSDEDETEESVEKRKLLKKQLQMMNMSSIDDVIELKCSDNSDDEGERRVLLTEKLHSEGQDAGKDLGEYYSEDETLTQVGNGKRVRIKPQKHSSRYSGGNVGSLTSSIPNSQELTLVISVLKQKSDKDNINEAIFSDEREPLKVENSNTVTIGNKHNPSAVRTVDVNKQNNKVYLDSGVRTDDFLAENVDDDNSQNSSANKCHNEKDGEDHIKISPKKKCNRRKYPENQNTANFSKIKKVVRADTRVEEENLSVDSNILIKKELTDITLQQHRGITVNGEERFFCDQCSKTYKKRYLLENHKRVHTGEWPFICPYCGKGFSDRYHLNQHIRIHTGEKPFSCTICVARLRQRSGLRTHMMLHTGKPFKCDQCDKSFVSNRKLLHHLRSHDGDHPHCCDECKSVFFSSAALRNHKSMPSRSRKHICYKCLASFVHEVDFKIHLASHLLEAECAQSMQPKLTDSMSSNPPPQSNPSPGSLTLTLDAVDQFCNSETIMMDLPL